MHFKFIQTHLQYNITDDTNTKDKKTCNCQQKNICPLNGNCFQSSLIYQTTITCKENSTTETFIRLTENDFKTRYRNHTTSFRHTKHRNSTELSKQRINASSLILSFIYTQICYHSIEHFMPR